ncbi:hypothetical protein DFH07DRAFT_792538 [Mycena maculata]|uniref:Uncharacterized protein n=1 Tax=Mycena maculata TaxID=230809 RepID=A0AAD7NYM3_9AGAR|nr:hypothetical protein DFH07DRAFT_792538 [Mycena maculata]
MDKTSKKRKRDFDIPALVYEAPGYRFAKLFTEASLDEIKEIVCKRLELSSISEFSLFYDTDIALVNDDDFAAFELYTQSAGSTRLPVVVKLLSQPHNSTTNVAQPSATQSLDSVSLAGGSSGVRPPPKKRKVVTIAPDLESISSAPTKQKSSALIESEKVSTASAVLEEPVDAPGEKRKRKKKQVDAADADSALPNSTGAKAIPDGSSGATEQPDPFQERPKKKAKVTENDIGPLPESSAPDAPITSDVPPKSSKKSTKKSKKDAQTEDVPGADNSIRSSAKSIGTEFNTTGDTPVESEPVSAKQRRRKDQSDLALPTVEKAKKPARSGKKVADQSPEDVSPDQAEQEDAAKDPAIAEFVLSFIDKKYLGRATDGNGHTANATKTSGSSSRGSKRTSAIDSTPCPVCKNTPFHLQYRCPVVVAGSSSIKKRIAELQQDGTTDHSQLIQRLRNLAEKSTKSSNPQNVNAHSPVLRAREKKGGISNPSDRLVGPKVGASGAGPSDDRSDSSSDDSDSPSSAPRKLVPPRPVESYVDAELDAIIRGPMSSRLTARDILSEDEEEDGAESVVLENDDEDDINFRRRSRKVDAAGSSGEEDDDNDENFPAGEVTTSGPLPIINLSARVDSRRSSTHSATEALDTFMALNARPSADIDLAGDKAVEDAMASDKVIFRAETPVAAKSGERMDEDNDVPSEQPQPTRIAPTPLTPDITAAGEDDPIQPAEGFPPTPAQQNKASNPGTPSTPRMVQRMKDRNGKIPVRLSQLEPPFSLSPQTQPKSVANTQDDGLTKGPIVESTPSQKTITRTRSSARFASLATIPPPTEVPPPAKRRRGPNKTPEQRAQEEAAKLAANEEKARLRAQAKPAGKKGKKVVEKVAERQDCPAPDASVPETASLPKPPGSAPYVEEPTTPMSPPLTASRTPMSQDEWTVLKPMSPLEGEYREPDSMRDELRSSSPEPTNDADKGKGVPLFYPAESQVPFPYSQYNSVPADVCPGSPKQSEDEDDEEEVAASMKPSQHPGNASAGLYRRLTDIASQPSPFLTKPTVRATDFPPTSFPRAKDKRDELYGKLTQKDDDSTDDSDSSASDAPSHIPKSRRAGMPTRR